MAPSTPSKGGESAPKAGPAAASSRPGGDDRAGHAVDFRLLRRLWEFVRPHRTAALACLALSLTGAGLRMAQPVLIHGILENEAVRGDVPGLIRKSLLFFLLVALLFAADVTFNYLSGLAGQRSMHGLRMALFRRVTRLDMAFFDRNPVGRLVTRMTSDIQSLTDLFTEGVVAMLSEMVMILGILSIMVWHGPRLTLVTLGALPPMLLTIVLFRRHSRKWYLETRARLAALNAFLQENVAGMRTVQSFNRQERNHAAFVGLNRELRFANVRTIFGFALFYPAVNVISNLTLAMVVWTGGRGLIEGRFLGGEPVTFATLFLFIQCVNMLFTPLRNLSEKYNLLQSAMASSARVFDLLDTPASIVAPPRPRPVRGLERDIVFDNAGFEYVPGRPAILGASFRIERGGTTAVVGATGSGKSTLVNLVTRLYDATSGRILLDGTDIREFDPGEYRRLFAVVPQEVFLFSGTVAGNIRLANPDLDDEGVWEALRLARADDFVRALPGGLNAPVHERGGSFSTGQKQLLAFARAIAADPKVLILDEATANIDTATERRIQEATATLLRGRTAFVVAHRLSTIRTATQILVMHKGTLRESGTHEELLARDGIYRRLHELQYRTAGEANAA